VSFTGGPETARHIIRNSAENFADVSLELGGKSPFIVFDDASIDSAVNGVVAGIFGASGQSCVAGSRLYLHESIADAFLERIVALAKQIRLGDPMDSDTEMGPLCTAAQVNRVKQEIAIAVEQGGTVLCGGGQPDGLSGHYFEPTVIECPQQSMQIVDTELFAPVLSVVRFRTEAEVIAMANDSKHGLAAGIFTRDSARSLRMVKAIKAGIVWVNTYRVISPVAEFGGMKNSGYGRESGVQAMVDYTRPKTVWMNMSDEPLSSPFQPR
jgi:aldehyde dehydrogenase (NAD+)